MKKAIIQICKTLMDISGVEDLQFKDFRTYFNRILKTKYNLTSKEAGVYIGNKKVVNEFHYSPDHKPTIREKDAKALSH